ncbi:MAG: SAM-dependent chlorinase/fluorinase [Acidimicrobiia bacterium]|nr:SAM-dependent chlorinase/fluorinase [Acidimicrobiia bacterium]MDX2466055.1 SAM-dependent chlorinase/fluorinase [Acidimicrobiia bacterium]
MNLPISFLSDFGRDDEFVGVVHGVIGRIAPEVRVIDIGHEFAQGDIRAGSLALMRSIQYMPQGVALAVIDPGVGTKRRAIAARTEWGVLIGPDNGLLAPAVAIVGGADKIVSIENPEIQIPAPGSTFDGRDLFGPAAAVIASGQATLEELGPEVDPDSVMPMMLPLVEHGEQSVTGEVLWVDHFGNAQLNVSPEDLKLVGIGPGTSIVLKINAAEFPIEWVEAYGDVVNGEGLLHVDSYGQIAVAVRDGSAVNSYPLDTGSTVTLRTGNPSLQIKRA